MKGRARLVILSGGAESVSIAVAEAAWRNNLPYAVISLVPRTLLRGAANCVAEVSLWEKNLSPDRARSRLFDSLSTLRISATAPLPVLPTEDDGLRLLNELGASLDGIAAFSRAAALRMGGLDKAELLTFLDAVGLGHAIAPTSVLHDIDDFDKAIERLGPDAIFKPVFKPWGTSIGPSGLKVVSRANERQPIAQVKSKLADTWHLSGTWVAQSRLQLIDGGERSACIVRSDRTDGCEVIERLKYPRAGGSAVWVSSTDRRDLMPIAETIADAVKIKGICEMSFLSDAEGKPRLIELNTRPWLQIDLVEKSGYSIVAETVNALEDRTTHGIEAVNERDWIHLERLAMSWLSGDCGPRFEVARRVMPLMNRETLFAVYSTRLPHMRRRWIARNLRKLFGMG